MPKKRKPGRPTITPGVKLTETAFFNLSKTDKRAIQAAAKRAGIKPAAYIRHAVQERLRTD